METFTNFKKQLFTQSESVTRTTSASTRSMGAIFVLRTCLLFCLLMGINVEAWGAWSGSGQGTQKNGVWYVFYETSSTNLSKGNSKECTLLGPGAQLSFEAKRTTAGTGSLTVTQDQGTTQLYSANPGTSYGACGSPYSLNVNSKKVTFKNTSSISTNTTKYVQNIKVTMAQYVEDPSKTSIAFGSAKLNTAAATQTFTVAWCNVPAMTWSVAGDTHNQVEVSVTNNAENGKYNTATFTVKYNHTHVGDLNATLTIKDTYNNYSKNITLTGTTAKGEQTISWENEPSMLVEMMNGSKQGISAVGTPSGLKADQFTSSNPEAITVDGNGLLVAVGEGEAVIYATQTGDDNYEPSNTISKTFTVLPKASPLFLENGFSENETKEMKVGDAVTLNLTNVSDGLNGDFTVVATTGNVIGVAREGNTLTFSADHAGETSITVAQVENTNIYALSKTYSFNVTRYEPVFKLSDNELELEESATLALENVDGASISFAPQGIVSYDGSTGVITAVAVGTTTLTVSQPQTNSIAEKETQYTITVSKKTPTLTVMMNGSASTSMSTELGSTVDVSFEKVSDANVEVSLESGDQFASYKDGVMTTAAVGSAEYRATLRETDTYQGKSVKFTLTVTANTNHLPISGRSYTVGSGDALDWSHKFETLSFSGIPDKLTFNFAYDYTPFKIFTYNVGDPSLQCPSYLNTFVDESKRGAGNEHMIYVEESADNVHWTVKWTNDDATNKDSHPSGDIELDPTTRYVRFHHSSNFKNYYTDIAITEKKYVNDPTSTTLDFGTKDINSGIDSMETLIDWCNVAPMTVSCDNPRFTVTPSGFGNYMEYNNTEKIKVFFTHTNATGTEEGDITIQNGTITKTIHVKAKTQKRQQTITWDNELAATGFALSLNEQIPTDTTIKVIATATNGGRITFTSDKPEFVKVVADTALLAIGIGNAQVTALQVGDAEYDTVRSTKTFVVTLKQKQKIIWDQNLYGLLTTDDTIKLTASATSGGPIVYTLDNDTVLQQKNDSVFRVIGEGKVRITARQEGFTDAEGVEWLEVEQDNFAVVRNPASDCGGTALSVASLVLDGSKTKETYDLNGIPGETITFKAKHGVKKPAWGVTPSYSPLKVEQYATINNELNWSQIFEQVVGTSENEEYSNVTIKIDQTATKIRFSTLETGTEHTIKDINLASKKFMESDIDSINQNVESNAIWSQEITISHSDIDLISISTKQGLLNLSATLLGEGCSDYGDDKFSVSFTPAMKDTTYRDTIVITDNKANPSTIVIPVELRSKGLNQSINDFDLPAEALATDEIAVATTASSGLEVAFLSSDSAVAYVEEGRLAIVSAGAVTITATQEGDAKYDAAQPIAKTIVITKVPTTITTAPTAATIVYGQSLEASVLSDGEGSVAGTFAWETPQAVPAAGTPSYNVVFTPTQSGIYATSTTLVSLRVEKATPVVTAWPTATEITIAQSVGDAELQNGEANVEGSFAWKNPTENRLKPGTYERTVVFTPADANYNTVESTVNVTVINVLARIIELPTIVSKNLVYGVTLAEVVMQGGSANVEGAFSWKDSTTLLLSGTKAYEAVFTPADLELYSPVNVEIEVSVAKAAPVVTTLPVAGGLVYGQLLKESQLTDYEVSVPGAYVWQNGEELLNAGEYQRAIVFLPTDTNYSTVPAELTVTVAKANASAVAPAAIENLVYNGEAQTLIAAGSAQGGELQYSLDGENWSTELPQAVNAGAYAIYYKVVADDNHNDYTAEAPVAAEIAKASASVTAPAAVDLVYTGEAQTLITAGEAQGGELQYSLDGENWSTELPTAVEGGKYTVSYRVAGDANHDSIDVASLAVTIDYTIAYELAGGNVETENPTHYNAETETFTLNNPTKEHYTFAGWTGSNGEEPQTEVTIEQGTMGNRTYTANWTINKYQITWLNADESLIDETEVEYGAMPEHADAEKAATAQYTYTFKGWTPALAEVTGVATYKAEFDSTVNVYTVIFQNADGSELQKTQLAYGETPVYEGEEPTKAADAQYTYTFNGWDNEIVAVTGNATYTATFSSTVNKYTITFKNGEAVLQSSEVEYGAMPVYTGETPVKSADAQNTYAFAGWDAEIVAVTGNATYTATFNSTVNKYTITWLNADESLIEATEVEYGAMPEHADAEKAATAQYTYTFKGWTPALAEVTGVATYKAEFDSTVNVYNVIFQNADGSELQKTQLAYGETPVYEGEEPTKAADAQYTYTFNSWDNEIVAVTGEAIYTATFSSTVNKYTITFKNGEAVLQSSEVEYGATPVYTGETPVKAADAQNTYAFAGWDAEIVAVTGNATYTATFNSTVNKYTITWLNADESLIDETEVEYGAMPEHADAEKAATAQYTYTFKGWTPALAEVTGVATYKAEFDSTVNVYTITFKNGEEVLQSSQLAYGETPVYEGEEPTKEADAQNTYAFAGWDAAIVAVTGNATYTATFNSTVNKYTITWLNADESLIDETEVEYGATPAHADAEKAATAQYTYTFKGWTPALAEVTGVATYKAEFDSTVNVYNVIFLNADGTELQSSQLAYGETPVYEGEEPTKAADAQYTYTFKGWDNEIVAVTGEATYTATFSSTLNKYLITFKNGEDVLQSSEVEYGAMPAYNGEAPTKDATAQYTYTFKGWTPALAEVTGEATYTAEFDSLAVVPEKQFQMIVWEQELSTIEVGDITLQLNAEAGSWLDVYYTSSDSTIAYVNEQNYVVALKAGEVTITAHQDGNETYLAAEPVSKTLTVTNNGQQGGGHDATAVDDAQGNSVQCTKVLRGNQVLIIRDGKTYNLRGQRVD